MNKLRWALRSMLPDFWIMNYPYSKSWDEALNRLLDKYDFEKVGVYSATLGDTEVWVENMPYAAFTPRIQGLTKYVRPSRSTIARAWEKLRETGFSSLGNFGKIGDRRG